MQRNVSTANAEAMQTQDQALSASELRSLSRAVQRDTFKIIINPLVNWIWIGVLVIVMGTGMALVPNAASVSVPVRNAVAVAKMEAHGMQPAGAGK